MKFNSQICTTRSQSEALLKLGLKKETADMLYKAYIDEDGEIQYCSDVIERNIALEGIFDFPAWSLHRLMCLVFNSGGTHVELFEDDDAYEILMYKIEIRIKEGYFSKEYLV